MAGAFDDLLAAPAPAQGQGAATAQSPSGGAFDDLLAAPAPSTAEATVAAYNALPWYKKALTAADDTARLVANGATLGYGDKIAAYGDSLFGSGDYATNLAAERAASQAAADRAGWAGTADSALGMVASGSVIAKGVGAAAGAADGVPLIGRILGNSYTQAAGTGAALGAGNAAGNDTSVPIGAATGAAGGVAGNAVAGALAGTVGKVAGAFNPAPAVPSAADLGAAARNAYAASENAGVILNPSATQRLADAIRGTMAEHGYDPSLEPGGAAVLNTLDRMDGQNATLKGVDTLRQVAGRMWQGSPSGGALGMKIQGNIDDFANSLQPTDILGGDAQQGVSALNNARALYSRAAKSNDLVEALTNAGNRAAVTGSGGNIDNATRQNVLRLMNSRDNWTPDERQALQDIVSGTPTQNALRLVGKLSPEGNGLMSALEIGGGIMAGAHGGPAEAAMASVVPAVGWGAKRLADNMTESRADMLGRLIRSGGDAPALQAPPNAVQQLAAAHRDLLARALTGGMISSPNDGSRNALVRALAQ